MYKVWKLCGQWLGGFPLLLDTAVLVKLCNVAWVLGCNGENPQKLTRVYNLQQKRRANGMVDVQLLSQALIICRLQPG